MTRVEAIRKMIELGGWKIDNLDGEVNSKGIFEIKSEGYIIGWMTEGDGKGLVIFKPFSGAYTDIFYETDNYKPAKHSFDELKNYVASENIRVWYGIRE